MIKANIKLKRGDDEIRLISLKTQSGEAVDLSVIERADLHAVSCDKKVLDLSTTNGLIEITNSDKGELLVTIPHYLTANQSWLIADYDLQLIYKSGRIRTVLYGQMQLIPDVTNLGAG